MSYSTDPVADAARHLAAVDAATERPIKAEQQLDASFMLACIKGDANALMDWAPTVPDHLRMSWAIIGYMPRRYQTVAELMQEGCDWADTNTELMQLVLNVANNTPGTQDQAKRLIERMATAWAKQNVEAS
jgi:hypothetical protein